jgi:hypothetical protein
MLKRTCLAITVAALVTATDLGAVAGKWTPEQILQHDPAWLRELGLEIAPQELWSPDGGGLLEAIVKVGGCSSGFVSAEGLLVTNHHCAFGILQLHSSPERDLIETGFLAGDRSAELAGEGTRASIPHRFEDVTEVIEAAVPAAADGLERWEAIEAKKKRLVADCEAQEYRRCRVAAYDDGLRYTLIEVLEFPDVRLVYAPPRAVGEYGGEVDNWMWPRHTGDFALLRVYAAAGRDPAPLDEGNLPYRPRRHLEVARQGVSDGSFVLVVGYPGRTYRRLIAAEMEERAERYFPGRAGLYRDWVEVMEAAGADSAGARVALASRLKSLANREKNARGQVKAIERGELLVKKRHHDQEALKWAAGNAENAAAVEAYHALESLAERKLATWDRDFLLVQIGAGPAPLSLAMKVARWALESEKPDAEREAAYQERNRDRTRDALERAQRRLHGPTDVELMVDWLGRMGELPEEQRVRLLDPLLAGEPDAIRARVEELFAASEVTDRETLLAMFAETLEQLRARHDPLLDLALRLEEEVILPMEKRHHRIAGEISRHRPVWRRAVEAWAGRPIDRDANSTLRVSLAHVEGYRPRDGVWMEPQTRLSGVLEKHTGEDPFDAPPAVREAAATAPASRWADARLEDVPVCFLATGDTTGGSSGSPVLNGRGELVAVNFDRVWENIANDFGYNPEIARNVSADIRYLLWLLEAVEGPRAGPLLEELGVAAKPGGDSRE